MDIDLIFKIAAIGIIVAVLNQLLIRSGPGGSGHDDHPRRACGGAVDAGAADQPIVCYHQNAVFIMSTPLSILCVAVISAVLVALFEKQQPAFALFVSAAGHRWFCWPKRAARCKMCWQALPDWNSRQAAMPTDVFCAARASCC